MSDLYDRHPNTIRLMAAVYLVLLAGIFCMFGFFKPHPVARAAPVPYQPAADTTPEPATTPLADPS